ncbi:tetracycline resistance -like protein [Corynebacterium pseudotuberculosis]|nr:tetracycline resistance -like protein [Corynebacterium pseudotuberculosis]
MINITAAKSGIAIGFYNLTINITIPLGIAYTAKLMDLRFGYSTILWVLAVIALLGAAIYVLADRRMSGAERARGVYVA